MTWQTGFTGIAYNTKMIKREITSFNDLADPAFKGHVGMMNDNVELGSAALLRMGVSPVNSTMAQWKESTKWLEMQRPLVAGYYDQSYISHLENGDTWISQAYSGDIFQANLSGYPHLKYVTPKEGQIVWHDNMVIPRQSQNALSALAWMNFYYTPKIAGIVEDWVSYVCPVPAAQEYILNVIKDPTVANSPLVFPSATADKLSHQLLHLPRLRRLRGVERHLQPDHRIVSTDLIEPTKPAYRQPSWLRRHSPPYWLSLVGGGWMLLFFLIPLASGLIVSLETGNPVSGYTLTWNWHIYSQLFVHSDIPYTTFFIRSLCYGVATTILSILIAYPMAYFIAFRVSVRWKSPLILLVLLSFFVSFVIRTDMWSFVLAQQGFVITTLHKLHIVSSNFHILGTSNAVIGGDIYNNLPFMVLPDLRGARTHRPPDPRSGARPLLQRPPGLHARRPAALARGHLRRCPVGLHHDRR